MDESFKMIDDLPKDFVEKNREYLFSLHGLEDIFLEKFKMMLADPKASRVLIDLIHRQSELDISQCDALLEKCKTLGIAELEKDELSVVREAIRSVLQEEFADKKIEEVFATISPKEILDHINVIFRYLKSREREWPDKDTERRIVEKFRKLKIVRFDNKALSKEFATLIPYLLSNGNEGAAGVYHPMAHQVFFPEEEEEDTFYFNIDERKTNDPEVIKKASEIDSVLEIIWEKLKEHGYNKTLIHELFHAISSHHYWGIKENSLNNSIEYDARRSGISTTRADGTNALTVLNEAITEQLTIATVARVLKKDLPTLEFKGKKYPIENILRSLSRTYDFERKILYKLTKEVPFKHFREAYFQKNKLLDLNRRIKEKFGITLQDVDYNTQEDLKSVDFLEKGFVKTLGALSKQPVVEPISSKRNLD